MITRDGTRRTVTQAFLTIKLRAEEQGSGGIFESVIQLGDVLGNAYNVIRRTINKWLDIGISTKFFRSILRVTTSEYCS